MRFLHTSDWHIGRTFHGHSTLNALGDVLGELPRIIREHDVDAVLVPGDLFDAPTPSASAYELLERVIRSIREAGATVIATSGNHDSATRLGFQSAWARAAGVHMLTNPERIHEPVVLERSGERVAVYGIPYLEPGLIRHLPGADGVRTHAEAIDWAMGRVRTDAATRDYPTVVLAHCFAAGVDASDAVLELERDLTVGGLDLVPGSAFDGVDYVALGHLHSPSEPSPGVHYSGAPLHLSFDEASKPRGAIVVEISASASTTTEWVGFPIPRRLTTLCGTLDELLADPSYERHAEDWVRAVLTDPLPQIDAMRRLQARFPHCVQLQLRPPAPTRSGASGSSTPSRTNAVSSRQVTEAFLEHVRGGEPVTEDEQHLLEGIFEALRAQELSR